MSVVDECSIKILDDVDVFAAECEFGVSGSWDHQLTKFPDSVW